jgi:hemoglobin-like flavoprotein
MPAAINQYLKILGHRHGERNIPPDLYPPFRDCLLETLSCFHGSDWSNVLQAQWHAAIEKASDVMLQGYSESGT